VLAGRYAVISCSNTAPDTSTKTRTQTEDPLGGAAMKIVSTLPVAMAKLAPMSVSVGAPVPSFVTSCQRVCVPRCKPTPTQLMAAVKLLIIDELGFVPLSKAGAELLFEMISQRYERGATLITSNLQFDEWTGTFGTERLTGTLLDRLTRHVNILEMNGESYRLAHSRARKADANT